MDCEGQISELESTLDSQVLTYYYQFSVRIFGRLKQSNLEFVML